MKCYRITNIVLYIYHDMTSKAKRRKYIASTTYYLRFIRVNYRFTWLAKGWLVLKPTRPWLIIQPILSDWSVMIFRLLRASKVPLCSERRVRPFILRQTLHGSSGSITVKSNRSFSSWEPWWCWREISVHISVKFLWSMSGNNLVGNANREYISVLTCEPNAKGLCFILTCEFHR